MYVIVARNGYRLDPVSAFKKNADAELVTRFAASPVQGAFVLWDPNDDADGFMISGDDPAELSAEFEKHFGEFLA